MDNARKTPAGEQEQRRGEKQRLPQHWRVRRNHMRKPVHAELQSGGAAECYPPETSSGTLLFVVVPVPSWPYRLSPQQ